MSAPSSIQRFPRHRQRTRPRALGFPLQHRDFARTIRDAGAAAFRLITGFRLARDQNFGKSFRLRAFTHALRQGVDVIAMINGQGQNRELLVPICVNEMFR